MRKYLLALATVAVLAVGQAQSAEFGVQLDQRGPAAYAYLSTDFSLGSLGSVGFWFSPSIEVIVAQTFIDGWVQAQFLVDAPFATLSARAKAELIDARTRYELRLGVLIGR